MWKKKPNKKNELISSKKSLTRHLEQFGELEINIISSNLQKLSSHEKNLYGRTAGCFYVREVLIGIKKEPLIYAKTITNIKNSKKLVLMLKSLKSLSLSNIVFKKQYVRSDFKYSNSLQKIIFKKNLRLRKIDISKVEIFRRSFFTLKKDKILLIEGFFKAVHKYESY